MSWVSHVIFSGSRDAKKMLNSRDCPASENQASVAQFLRRVLHSQWLICCVAFMTLVGMHFYSLRLRTFLFNNINVLRASFLFNFFLVSPEFPSHIKMSRSV